jgi:hypothetical protein
MVDVAVSTPPRRGTAWSVETNPKYTRAWLDSLAPLDNVESARELYQGLYALNRSALDPTARLELMQLYRDSVRTAGQSLEGAFTRVTFPLSEKLRRLALSLCRLHLEMAAGYKLSLQDLSRSWLTPWRRRQTLVLGAEQALYHLTEVVLRCYQLYLPYPAGVWRDAHALFSVAALHGREDEPVKTQEDRGAINISVSQRYRRMLLLGAANPYQMPYGECATVHRFLGRWIDQARLALPEARTDGSGCFLVDGAADAPPAPLGRRMPNPGDSSLRLIDASELVRTLHVFLRRLEKGEPAAEMELGIDGLDSACHDMLQRLHRMYAQVATRRHSRIKRNETVMICAGIGAVHFFAGGQRSAPPAVVHSVVTEIADTSAGDGAGDADSDYVALDDPGPVPAKPALRTPAPESFRVDRWQVRDVSPQGLLLCQDSEARVRFRIGDVLGIQRTNLPGHWSVGLVRWFKGHGETGIDVGVELIAPSGVPASIRPVAEGESSSAALMLPAVEAAHRPATILVARGVAEVGKDCYLTSGDGGTRRVRVLDAIERTSSIEQIVVGTVIE